MTARPAPVPAPKDELLIPEKSPMARLAALHREAVETARLANLLGRVPQIITGLVVAALVALLVGGASLAREISWSALAVLGIGSLALSYRRAIVAPFERGTLEAFASNLKAILFYAGFAWGAGAFLVLPANASVALTAAFAIVPSALVAMLVREVRIVSFFIAPTCLLTALAVPVRPLPEAFAAAPLILLAWAGLAAAIFAVERLHTSRGRFPQIRDFAEA
jgi:hypothetical protein